MCIRDRFGRQFWEYVKEAGYEHLNKSTGNTQFYRFTSPKSKEYPYMIEIISRNPDFIILEDDAVLTPLPIDDEISSLSAILLNEAYYELLKTGQKRVDGIPVSVSYTHLADPLQMPSSHLHHAPAADRGDGGPALRDPQIRVRWTDGNLLSLIHI